MNGKADPLRIVEVKSIQETSRKEQNK